MKSKRVNIAFVDSSDLKPKSYKKYDRSSSYGSQIKLRLSISTLSSSKTRLVTTARAYDSRWSTTDKRFTSVRNHSANKLPIIESWKRWSNAGPPPQGIVPTKGGVHIIACRGFVYTVLYDPRADVLLDREPETDEVVKPFLARYTNWFWDTLECHGKYVHSVCVHSARDLPPMKDTINFTKSFIPWHTIASRSCFLIEPGTDTSDLPVSIPLFIPILTFNSCNLKLSNYLSGIPERDEVVRPFLARYTNWFWDTIECHGKYVHSVCIHSARDLHPMKDTKKLFVNKFHQELHTLAYACLEELLFIRTRDRHL
ncbi:hypothetical protein MAR_015654 [Mya arenaria]|uniref:Uncharacterized protein n=1 Tax=Mya arenaria TaxID=6604 RepID=A0ABY7FHL0_MYAAR|nr:hypothetical protein MAR_015654 [Mya arenaria]